MNTFHRKYATLKKLPLNQYPHEQNRANAMYLYLQLIPLDLDRHGFLADLDLPEIMKTVIRIILQLLPNCEVIRLPI
jgi:hypothetical protein